MMPDFPQLLVPRDTLGPLPVLHLFGEPFVSVGARRVDIPRSCRRLLVFVALRPSRVERPYAAGSLWPINDEARADGNLRSALWRLNRMDVQLLSVDKYGLTMRDEVAVDLRAVSAWATRVIDGTATTADLRAAPPGMDSLELLPGWYDDWALMERERIRQRLLHALDSQSRHLMRMGLYADAVDVAMAAVGAEPLRESAQRLLIEAHLAAGNWVEGRRSLAVYAGLLDRELGVRPAPELTALLRCPPSSGPAGSRPGPFPVKSVVNPRG
ncbi:AfsR/SARP family transcriptional regulator [Streptomyces sp. H27-D2]|uniref:AfsR/SARP family transcriptional regulator n=1 Tax=Streptomyces sp. H27-D2 TaxID=3046304 RepID=UPI002DBFFF19|nr:BTAD domain-containing putative transcriptional regulator [Streptomyces sp. H27-D2]MEC4018792.1 BTAD domain-containing putative transcriptional regulator [Streptomyces sp. H27-D2]